MMMYHRDRCSESDNDQFHHFQRWEIKHGQIQERKERCHLIPSSQNTGPRNQNYHPMGYGSKDMTKNAFLRNGFAKYVDRFLQILVSFNNVFGSSTT